jgi:dynein heavy chain
MLNILNCSRYQDTSNLIPLLFVLSTGSDPFEAFKRFASDMAYKDKVHSISLGQGQGPVAEKIIFRGVAKGEWVFLQVCTVKHVINSFIENTEKRVFFLLRNYIQSVCVCTCVSICMYVYMHV